VYIVKSLVVTNCEIGLGTGEQILSKATQRPHSKQPVTQQIF